MCGKRYLINNILDYRKYSLLTDELIVDQLNSDP